VGNLNNELGVPMTLLALREEHQAAVIEMGISDFGEMTRLTAMVQPTIAIITIIGYAHLDNLGDRAGVYRAKTEILHGLSPDGLALFNGDDDLLRPCAITDIDPKKTGVEKRLYGLDAGNDYRAADIVTAGESGTTCTLHLAGITLPVTIPAFGLPFVYAALAAAAVGHRLGMTPEEIRRGIADFHTVAGRANVLVTEHLTIIDDCYNANPSSVSASLISLSGLDGRRVAILGDMAELGPDSATLHREIGAHAARRGIDCLICVGEMSAHTHAGAVSVCPALSAFHFSNKAMALEEISALLCTGDQILVKASRSGRFEEIVAFLKEVSF